MYKRTKEHKKEMSEICSKNATSSKIEAKKAKHKIKDDIEYRFCEHCNNWFELNTHFHKRACKNKHGGKRYGYDCKAWKKPRAAFYSARSRCKNNKYYKEIEVKITIDVWVPWWETEQARLRLNDPVVDRIDSSKHYELGNIRLIERSDNSRRAYFKAQTNLVDRYNDLLYKYNALLKEHNLLKR